MDSLIFYWVLTLIVLIVLIILTDVGTASIITTFIMVMKFMTQQYSDDNVCSRRNKFSGFETEKKTVFTIPEKTSTSFKKEKTLPVLKPEVILENAELLEDVLYPKMFSADDKIFDASVNSGYKNKKALEIRSHWNNNNWKKYYDHELGIHENRSEWWGDDDFELSKKHVVI
jgi:hypothetical protein